MKKSFKILKKNEFVGVGLEYEEKVEEDETVGVVAGLGREKKVSRVFQKLTWEKPESFGPKYIEMSPQVVTIS